MKEIENLKSTLEGELEYSNLWKTIYATDASVYKQMPMAIAFPKTKQDLKKLISFANNQKIGLIPRTAGTSLSGQCVGDGIIVDFSRHFNKILEVNKSEKWVRVQPGIIRDELNHVLKAYQLFFSPNTSTANRAMIGGMVGNNSCGSYSITYGTTRDHLLEINTLLSDGSETNFKELDEDAFKKKLIGVRLENKIYQQLNTILADESNQTKIKEEFPKITIERRNTGYAIDELIYHKPFNKEGENLNLAKLLCGSEGTLALTTEVKLNLDDLPPNEIRLLCVHFKSLEESLNATILLKKLGPRALELMDKIVLDCTKDSLKYKNYRFFLQGEPEAILILEIGAASIAALDSKTEKFKSFIDENAIGYTTTLVEKEKANLVWDLRSAGLGLLFNIPGDKKPVAVVEDTAVDLNDLPDYIDEFGKLMQKYNQKAVYYAHVGAGELHLRPILDLKHPKDREDFKNIAFETAQLVKKYKGSLSGEHGDGRVRAPFLKLMIGDHNYGILKEIKQLWDPNNIFNPGKIIDAKEIDADLRFTADQKTKTFGTAFDFSKQKGILRAAEACNGSGDCRKLALSGGTMCPSFMASRLEKDTTRARANMLREVLTRPNSENAFNNKDLIEILDLCLSCKGCTSECPSNVDMATLKAEALHQYYKSNKIPLRAQVFSNITRLNKLISKVANFNNLFLSSPMGNVIKSRLGIASQRSFPKLAKQTLVRTYQKNKKYISPNTNFHSKVYLYADEFTNYYDVITGTKAIGLLNHLGYEVEIAKTEESGRAAISKGLLDMAKKYANKNVTALSPLINSEHVLIGIEPSAILTFRDEYPKLVDGPLKEKAKKMASFTFTIDEFLFEEFKKGKIATESFESTERKFVLHGHCHQKALSDLNKTKTILEIPENCNVEIINSGCCGMAGSFGYEKEHYALSMEIGELVLFPKVRSLNGDEIVVANGTSCRHQIFDGTEVQSFHAVEVLFDLLR